MSLTMTLQPLESTPNVDHFNGLVYCIHNNIFAELVLKID